MAMIGGGPGAFIGPVHRLAAELDREIELVAGVFSSDARRSKAAADVYLIDPERAYGSLDEMFTAEKARGDGIDFVSIVTPNHNHLLSAKAALAAGLPVICDKPVTASLSEARELAGVLADTGLTFCLTHTYTGYPLVREMKARIAAGELGEIRKVVVEYPQGWLSHPAEGKQAEWRVDPSRAGAGGCIGDIGTHAFSLAEFATGLKITRLLADLGAVVPGRKLDDDVSVLLRFENGARGVLLASQIELGELNGLRIRVYGDKAGIRWRQEYPNQLELLHGDGRQEIINAGTDVLGPWAASRSRTPGGHPEGYLEAFANIYRDFAALLRGDHAPLLPGIEDGLRGMAFIETAVSASAQKAGWVDLEV
ncbi:Gfo/Idh/MocA family protein [Aurantiacibacter flavus]|uniref:Gfo/Idh/MocA family oxidoreductase n=1 Tax=Aurantiacibacter flavus TaxID=3145232 RepID=A0ABV0CSM1_9SPHN